MACIEDPASLISDGVCYAATKKTPKVAVIGAGPAGLCAARHLFAEDSGFTGDVFEQKSTIGGTWVYTEETGKDKYGQQIHSPLYHGLETNLPKEVMEYEDFPYDIQNKSYLSSEEVLDYLNKYTAHFNLLPHIKLNHLVKRVAPVGKSWSLTALDLETNIEHVSLYDAVMVCSGPTSIPVYPKIDGLARFAGKQLHAKSFRRGENYKGQRVLIIGLGPSGMDIAYKLLPHAKQVVLSHNYESLRQLTFPADLMVKPAAASMSDTSVTFVDGSSEDVDVVIHCTGYTYNFPFLTKDCGIVVNQYVSPLYLHLFNIEAPSIVFLGLPRIIPYYYCVEYQTKAVLAVLRGDVELPSREEMLKITEEETREKLESGQKKKDVHRMGKKSKEYFESLQKLANLPPLPEVRYNIFFDAFFRVLRDYEGFRYTAYKILDDENFEVMMLERPEPQKKIEEVVVAASKDGEQLENGDAGNSVKTEEGLADRTDTEEKTEEVALSEQDSIEKSQVTENEETIVASEEPVEVTNIISTIQTAMTTNDVVETVTESHEKLRTEVSSTEVFETRSSGVVETVSSEILESSSEILETTTTEVVEERKIVTERRVEEIVNTIQVEAVVEKHEKILNGEQLSDGVRIHEDENVVKHR